MWTLQLVQEAKKKQLIHRNEPGLNVVKMGVSSTIKQTQLSKAIAIQSFI